MMKNKVLGLWNMGDDSFHSIVSPQEGKKIIKEAIKIGINTFDSAFSYKNADTILSSALRELNIERNQVKLISKVMPVPTLKKKVDISLRRLNTSYFDYLLLHWPTEKISLYKALKEVEALKAKGIAYEIGISNFPLPLLKKAILDFDITVHERPLSLIWNKDYKEERELGIKLFIYAPLAMGILFKPFYQITDSRKDLYIFKEGIKEYNELLAAMNEISLKDNVSKATIALAWVECQNPDSIIFGVSRPEQLKIPIYELKKEDLDRLNTLTTSLTQKAPMDNIFSHQYLV